MSTLTISNAESIVTSLVQCENNVLYIFKFLRSYVRFSEKHYFTQIVLYKKYKKHQHAIIGILIMRNWTFCVVSCQVLFMA